MSFHPELAISHVQMHAAELREEIAGDHVTVEHQRQRRRTRAARRRARLLDTSALTLATLSGWFGHRASALHARARLHRAGLL
jgi:hypothetical protein